MSNQETLYILGQHFGVGGIDLALEFLQRSFQALFFDLEIGQPIACLLLAFLSRGSVEFVVKPLPLGLGGG